MKKIIVITIAALALASCGIEHLTERPASVETTTRPTPTQATGDCSNVDILETSALVPDDWNAWCEGYLFGYQYAQSYQGSALCDEFWATSDEAILDTLTSGSDAVRRDEAIGMIDALWIVC